jgi:RimJ/RimL family protein N-acetyltransferase
VIPWRPVLPVLTDRLILRVHEPRDVDDMLAYHSDPEVVRYIPWPERTREQVVEAMQARLEQGVVESYGNWLVLAIELRAERTVIGEVLLKNIRPGEAELGYAIHAGFHGRGIALEATRAMLTLGVEQLALQHVRAVVDARNSASIRLLERLGFTPVDDAAADVDDDSREYRLALSA